ncbi:MAG: holin-like protein [Paraglaciecola sp.]
MVKNTIAFIGLIFFWQCGRYLSLIIPLPGALLGLLLLLIILLCFDRAPRSLEAVSQFLLLHLSLFFVPAAMGILFYAEQLQAHLWLFLLAIVSSTVFSIGLTAWFSQYIQGKRRRTDDD